MCCYCGDEECAGCHSMGPRKALAQQLKDRGDAAVESRAQERITAITRNLYPTMPGAPGVLSNGAVLDWSAVESTEHYTFCNSIANLIVRNSCQCVNRQ